MKLIKLSDFIQKIKDKLLSGDIETINVLIKYSTFLKTELKLCQFIPVDENGNLLFEPLKNPSINLHGFDEGTYEYQDSLIEWNKAIKRIIFKDFQYVEFYNMKDVYNFKTNIVLNINEDLGNKYDTIEDLVNDEINLELNDNGIKFLNKI